MRELEYQWQMNIIGQQSNADNKVIVFGDPFYYAPEKRLVNLYFKISCIFFFKIIALTYCIKINNRI
mgnify:CR=1 FL=1